jgi:sugar-specific transcriptional regulator TrmB
MKKYIYILSQLGLPDHASKIYLGLLEQGSSSLSQLTESTGLQRIQIYRNIPVLVDRGFVFVTLKGKRKIYSPASPDILRTEYESLQQNTFHVLDELGEKYKNSQNQTNIIFGTGKKAIENVYHDVLSVLPKGWMFYRISSEINSQEIFDTYLPKNYRRDRDKKEIERMIIYSDKTAALKQKKLERDMRAIDSKVMRFNDNIIFTIYGDKISLIDFNKETAIIIESPEMARFQEKVFKLLFKKL